MATASKVGPAKSDATPHAQESSINDSRESRFTNQLGRAKTRFSPRDSSKFTEEGPFFVSCRRLASRQKHLPPILLRATLLSLSISSRYVPRASPMASSRAFFSSSSPSSSLALCRSGAFSDHLPRLCPPLGTSRGHPLDCKFPQLSIGFWRERYATCFLLRFRARLGCESAAARTSVVRLFLRFPGFGVLCGR